MVDNAWHIKDLSSYYAVHSRHGNTVAHWNEDCGAPNAVGECFEHTVYIQLNLLLSIGLRRRPTPCIMTSYA